MTTTLTKMVRAQQHGIKRVFTVMRVSKEVGIPFSVLCAVLEKESNGGDNIFGHDPTIFAGAGVVTESKYRQYKKQRDADLKHRKMQGVGPMQLTHYSFQDKADALGGCWIPYNNIKVGAQLLKSLHDAHGTWEATGTAYNGSHTYGLDFAKRVAKWDALLK